MASTLRGADLIARARDFESQAGVRHTDAGGLIALLCNELESVSRFAAHLVSETVCGRCELTALPEGSAIDIPSVCRMPSVKAPEEMRIGMKYRATFNRGRSMIRPCAHGYWYGHCPICTRGARVGRRTKIPESAGVSEF